MSQDFHPEPPPVQNFQRPAPPLSARQSTSALWGALIALGGVCAVLIVTCCWLVVTSRPKKSPSVATKQTDQTSATVIEETNPIERNAEKPSSPSAALVDSWQIQSMFNEGDAQREGLLKKLAAVSRREDFRRTQDRNTPIIPDILDSIRVGSVGNLPYPAIVVQRISESDALLRITVEDRVAHANATGSYGARRFLVYCKDFNFSGVVDDDTYKFSTTVHCTGTKTYLNPLGTTKTVLCVEPIDLAAHFQKEKAARLVQFPAGRLVEP